MYERYVPLSQTQLDAIVRRIKIKHRADYICNAFKKTDVALLGVLASELVVGDNFTSTLVEFARAVEQYQKRRIHQSLTNLVGIRKALEDGLNKDNYKTVLERVPLLIDPIIEDEFPLEIDAEDDLAVAFSVVEQLRANTGDNPAQKVGQGERAPNAFVSDEKKAIAEQNKGEAIGVENRAIVKQDEVLAKAVCQVRRENGKQPKNNAKKGTGDQSSKENGKQPKNNATKGTGDQSSKENEKIANDMTGKEEEEKKEDVDEEAKEEKNEDGDEEAEEESIKETGGGTKSESIEEGDGDGETKSASIEEDEGEGESIEEGKGESIEEGEDEGGEESVEEPVEESTEEEQEADIYDLSDDPDSPRTRKRCTYFDDEAGVEKQVKKRK